MEYSVQGPDITQVLKDLERIQEGSSRATHEGIQECALVAERESQRNAPISPTRGQMNRQRKTRRRTRRKSRATSRPSPGRLVDSIEQQVMGDEASIFVSTNSPAGKYAEYIHDKKGKPGGWQKRGPGTKAKGNRADEKFIERAVMDNRKKYSEILEAHHRKVKT